MKDQKDLIGLSRSPFLNQLHSIKDSVVKRPPDYDMHGLTEENKLKWIWKTLSHLGNSRYAYQSYSKPGNNNGIFKMSNEADKEIKIALLADWASATAESQNIAQLAGVNDYSVHLGDTYYTGNSTEIADNFNDKFGGPWPYGTLGSFALMGNHEMYSSGKSYFTELLPYMGVYAGDKTAQQEASFFCLENDSWRIIGLDTGYDSLKGWLGIKADLNAKLPDVHFNWLRDVVKLNDDKRGLIFLSHHQYFSGFEKDEFFNPGKQIASLFGNDRTVLWIWGHEHRLALYGCNQLPNGCNFFSRCIGNGGMPVEIGDKHKPKNLQNKKDPENRNLVLFDERERKVIAANISLGHNGYVILKFKNNDLVIEYYDDNSDKDNRKDKTGLIIEEKWTLDKATGKLKGINIEDKTIADLKKLTQFSDNIKDAITEVEKGNV